VSDQPPFAVAGRGQKLGGKGHFAVATCDPNERARPIHTMAMIAILAPDDHVRGLPDRTTGGAAAALFR
jgi:hypothetical protein